LSKKLAAPPVAIDLFCGAGGSSWGARNAGAKILAGFDMWSLAGEVYKDNFPEARFYESSLENIDPTAVAKELGRVDLMLASPECTNHSVARGTDDRDEKSKETALQVTRFAEAIKPRWIVIENVGGMKSWSMYGVFLDGLAGLGYHTREQILNAARLGVPQSRKRLFILCDKQNKPSPIPMSTATPISAREVIDWNGTHKYSPLHQEKRAEGTLERAYRAIQALGSREPFLLVYYGTDKGGGWQSVDVPLRTITTLDRFALVRPNGGDHEMRMLQPPELRAAMGMPKAFRLRHGNRRERIKLLGNAVCPPVMRRVVSNMTRSSASDRHDR